MTFIMKDSVYWDDICYKKGVTDNGMEETRTYYSCYLHRDYLNHCNSKKYKKMYKAVQEDPNSIKCEHCNQKFSEEGYKIHCERNKPLWDMQKIGCCMMMSCNNFKADRKRYSSIDAYVESTQDKPKQKRTGVGKWSPITGITRPPNKPKGWANKPPQMEDHYILCKGCDGMLNLTTLKYSNEGLMEITGLKMCDCEDEPNMELIVEDIKEEIKDEPTVDEIKDSMKQWIPDRKGNHDGVKYTRNPNYIAGLKCRRTKDDDREELTEEEHDLIKELGTMLEFDDWCDLCGLPHNDENYSSRLLTHLDLDVCECD